MTFTTIGSRCQALKRDQSLTSLRPCFHTDKPDLVCHNAHISHSLIARPEGRGLVDTGRPVEFYLPELKDSDFAGITVRNILDMASGVDCPDGNYARGT